jgi:DNA-binding response OmpR family regulator
VILLIAPGAEKGRVLGLELGADDHVTEGLNLRALGLWVQSVLRRTEGSPAVAGRQTLRVADIELDVIGRRAEKGGRPLQLTGREFDLLAYLLANPGRAFTRAELLEKVWGWVHGDRSTITVHIRRLREKIEADPGNPTLIATVWGIGYRLDPPDDTLALPPQRVLDAG